MLIECPFFFLLFSDCDPTLFWIFYLDVNEIGQLLRKMSLTEVVDILFFLLFCLVILSRISLRLKCRKLKQPRLKEPLLSGLLVITRFSSRNTQKPLQRSLDV